MTIPSEANLVDSLSLSLTSQGFVVRSEVSNMGQSIDLVATKNDDVTAIEVKRKDWRRALEQCKAHMAVADFIVIAISVRKLSREFLQLLHLRGWGLMICDLPDDSWELIIKPERNEPWKPQRDAFMAGLNQIKPNDV